MGSQQARAKQTNSEEWARRNGASFVAAETVFERSVLSGPFRFVHFDADLRFKDIPIGMQRAF